MNAPASNGVLRRPGFSLRPIPARWFELLTFRDDLTLAVETLARTRRVELDARSGSATPFMLPDLQQRLEEYNRLAQRYHAYWPSEDLVPSDVPGNPLDTLDAALRQLRAWRAEAEPVIRATEAMQGERTELMLLRNLLTALARSPLSLERFASCGPALAARGFVLPLHSRVQRLPPGVLTHAVTGSEHDFLLALGPPAEVDALEQELSLIKGRRMLLPSWLAPDARRSLQALEQRQQKLEAELAAHGNQLDFLEDKHGLRGALGDISRLEWFLTHVAELPVTENFAWVTGWTADPDIARLQAALDKAGVRHLLRLADAPKEKEPPLVLSNPAWAQPFELFARLFGTPSADEADPSRLLALFVPVLFGYMFGDVGQGAVLFITGLVLARRYPGLRLLIPGGFMSMVFGLLFGSVFSREELIPALWLRPLEQPLLILGLPLIGGVAILVLGLALGGLEAGWRGRGGEWWREDAAQLLLYLGILGSLITPYAALVASAAFLWFLAARVQHAHDLRAVGGALGQLVESTFQLLINTLSFARVGAFALAHAGLSAAVVALADTAGHGIFAALVMVVGNLIIIGLEGLVVSIQITRLVLFEFFIRFLRGGGRGFHPLAAPPTLPTKKRKRSTP